MDTMLGHAFFPVRKKRLPDIIHTKTVRSVPKVTRDAASQKGEILVSATSTTIKLEPQISPSVATINQFRQVMSGCIYQCS
jgi:hypothetical protein